MNPSAYPLFNQPKPSQQIEANPLPHNGTETSRRAAERVTAESAGSQRARILDALMQCPEGLTDAQIQENTGITPDAERPRRWQLVRDGLVRDSGRTRKYGLHDDAVVWVAVEGNQ